MNKVSVIMPCRNDGNYIIEAIESVQNQTYKNIEIVIIDDGSDEEKTVSILRNLPYSQVKIIRTEGIGPAAARNEGIKVSSGKYILPLDSDDKIDASYIEKAVQILEQNSSIGVVYCYANLFGLKSGRWELPTYSFEKMLLDNIVFVTALFHKREWERVGGFNEKMKHGMEDYDFWIAILDLGFEIHQIPEVLFHYRIKPVSRTTEFMTNVQVVRETYEQIYANHPDFYKKHSAQYAAVLREALVDQIFLNRTLQESLRVLEKIKRIPFMKQFLMKFILKKR
ncbi:glycosyltransferase [Paenibacillus sp. strain BS8-2]